MLNHFNRVRLYATPWIVARQAPLPMGFSRQEYWGGLPFPSPGDLSDLGIESTSLGLLHWQVDSLPLSHQGILEHIFWGYTIQPTTMDLG